MRGQEEIPEFMMKAVALVIVLVFVVGGFISLTEFKATIQEESGKRVMTDFAQNVLASGCTAVPGHKGLLDEDMIILQEEWSNSCDRWLLSDTSDTPDDDLDEMLKYCYISELPRMIYNAPGVEDEEALQKLKELISSDTATIDELKNRIDAITCDEIGLESSSPECDVRQNIDDKCKELCRNEYDGFSCLSFGWPAGVKINAENTDSEKIEHKIGPLEISINTETIVFPASLKLSDGKVVPARLSVIYPYEEKCSNMYSGSYCVFCASQTECEAAGCLWNDRCTRRAPA